MAKDLYRAKDVTYSEQAEAKIQMFTEQGFGHLPICMAKTQYSFSHDANLKGAPEGFTLPVGEVRCSAGAGFLVVLVGAFPTIPAGDARPYMRTHTSHTSHPSHTRTSARTHTH